MRTYVIQIVVADIPILLGAFLTGAFVPFGVMLVLDRFLTYKLHQMNDTCSS
jgi:hypothetical protein